MTTHNIHPVPKNNREWNESQPPGAAPIMQSFAREEVAIPVKCNVHPWMKAYIAVLGNPYFQVTGKDGSFTLKNVPPGTYTVCLARALRPQDQMVTVGRKREGNVPSRPSPGQISRAPSKAGAVVGRSLATAAGFGVWQRCS